MSGSQGENIGTVEEMIGLALSARRIVAFTGAGISTESGIPDYRGPQGVWATNTPPTLGDFLENEQARLDYWDGRRARYRELVDRKPNEGHRALVRLERAGLLRAVITQNIDGLHQKAGNSPDLVWELHGTSHTVRCFDCPSTWPADEVQGWLDNPGEPRCPDCGGIIRAATVLFGETMPAVPLAAAMAAANDCDLMIVIGSSLVVNPAARLPVMAKQQGARLAIVNRTSTPLDHMADIVVRGEAGATLATFADFLTMLP